MLRLFRLSKMLRLARIQRILAKYEDLEFVQNYAGMGGLMFVMFIMAHILACLWYMIGLDDSHFRKHHKHSVVVFDPQRLFKIKLRIR